MFFILINKHFQNNGSLWVCILEYIIRKLNGFCETCDYIGVFFFRMAFKDMCNLLFGYDHLIS